MEHHKMLYKDSRTQTPRKYNRLNRELQVANRCKQRSDRFQDSRNIERSPTPHKEEIIIPLCPQNKENNGQQENQNSMRLAKIVCDSKNPEKLTKQEAFLKRFVGYMDMKKQIKKQQQEVSSKKKPFVSVVNCGRQMSGVSSATSNLVPKGHPEGFRPPAGLKNPLEDKKVAVKGRPSIYTVVATPPPKSAQAITKQMPTNKVVNKPWLDNKKVNSVKKTPANITCTKLSSQNMVKTNEKPKSTALATNAPIVLKNNLKPRVLKMPPPPAITKKPPEIKQVKLPAKKPLEIKKSEPSSSSRNGQAGAAAKIRSMAAKRAENIKPTKKSPLKSGRAGLTQNMKAKKPLNNSKRINVPPSLQINGKKLLNLLDKNKPSVDDMVIQTPKDINALNPFEPFVTSTRLKNSSQIMDNLEGTTPKESVNNRKHNNSSAKRNIMSGTSENLPANELKNDIENIANKYNFVRYSEAANVSNHDDEDNDNMQDKEEENLSDDENKTLVQTTPIEEKTPIKSGPEERPANYLSPFVSVSRGKVSLKKEKEKRNSVYLQNPAETDESAALTQSPKYSVEVRRTLEAVNYFRKQLKDEIDRLHRLCDVWEAYKTENFEKIQNANGEDMINVSVGQTRLLTSKKFMQFKSLIDRCEAGATGIGAVEYDGSEDTKPITSEDLEGFWSMLGIQVDNLDKRFDNLERWKLNDWQDPDEVKPKIKKNLTKVVKKAKPAPKAKPNTALQQMLRKMQAEMRKNKNNQEDINNDIVLTPSKQKPRRSSNSSNSTPRKSTDNSTSRRLSIVVKDRKYFSPAATVISVSSPNRRASIQLQRKTSQDSPKILNHIQKFNEALDNMQTSFDLRKSVLINGNSRRMSLNPTTPSKLGVNSMDLETINSPTQSPKPTGRKSILKTPGTAKSRLRNVIFNEKLRVKNINFFINDDEGNAEQNCHDDTHEEDLAKSCEAEPQSTDSPKRTLTLRNRKVRLRPSSEIVIPFK